MKTGGIEVAAGERVTAQGMHEFSGEEEYKKPNAGDPRKIYALFTLINA